MSASDAWHHLKEARPAAAARTLWDARNLTSLRAVWESQAWVRRL